MCPVEQLEGEFVRSNSGIIALYYVHKLLNTKS